MTDGIDNQSTQDSTSDENDTSATSVPSATVDDVGVPEFDPGLMAQLEDWINTPDWKVSWGYMKRHASTLLTDDAERLLALIYDAQEDDETREMVAQHQQLQREACKQGIDAAYDALLAQRALMWVNTGNAEMDGLFVELRSLNTLDEDPRQQDDLCQRILRLDDQIHVLDQQQRGVIWGTRGNRLQEMARGLGGDEHIATLRESIACYDTALRAFPREADPLNWAGTFSNRSNTLRDLAQTMSGDEKLKTLRAADDCCDQALLEFRRDVDPLKWAATLSNKGATLDDIADCLTGVARAETLGNAIACFDQALLARKREIVPLDWATTLNNKGSALDGLADTLSTTERAGALRDAITCYDQALLERKREVVPLDWATTLNNKASTLDHLANGMSGMERIQTLRDALDCYDHALLEYRRDVAPLDWAMTLSNKGSTLDILADSLSGIARMQSLRDASACYDQALLEYRREITPFDWAMALNNKGGVLQALADGMSGAERIRTLGEAITCYDQALEERHREVAPANWAATMNNMGTAFGDLADELSGDELLRTLHRAIECYDQALLERRHDIAPLDWAATINNKGAALSTLANYITGEPRLRALRDSIACYDQALSEYRREISPFDWAGTLINKGDSFAALADDLNGSERADMLQSAEVTFRDALTAFPSDVQPFTFRRVARALARVLLRQTALVIGDSRETVVLEDAWQVASSAVIAANLLELQAPSLVFRQQEWAENASLYNLAGCIRARQGYLEEAIALIERGRARGLAEAAGRRTADLALLAPDDRAEYLRAVEQVQANEAAGRQGGDPLALVAEARTANARLAEVVERLRAIYPGFLPERQASIMALAGALQAGEALVYLIPQEPGTVLLAIPHDGEARMSWLADLTRDDVYALTVTRGVDDDSQRGFLPAALGWLRHDRMALKIALDALLPDLGDRLMRTVVELVRACGCHRVALVPSGYLSVLPLHAASYKPLAGERPTAPDGRRYACDDLAITYAPSGLTYLDARQTALRQAATGPAERIFVVGNPHLTPQDIPWTKAYKSYLRYGEWEARQVAELAKQRIPPLAVDLALTDEAIWTRVMNGLGGADLAHLALHATFNFVDPSQSALLVAFQKKLLLRDLLDPRQAKLTQLRLVVLSACQSAMGDVGRQSEEAVGLFGALLAGGVPGVIGTLWSVYDLATAALMESFAHHHLIEGDAPELALRRATRELRGIPARASMSADSAARSDAEDSQNAENEQAQPSSALGRWLSLEADDPEAAGVTRNLTAEELDEVARTVHEFSSIPRNHPIYWAAFVFHGTSVPLSGAELDVQVPQ